MLSGWVVSAALNRSLPSRGAWIEMDLWWRRTSESARRSPHGERGLKWLLSARSSGTPLSLPSRGAWIEIWVIPSLMYGNASRSPHGERGLKLGHQIPGVIVDGRSPYGKRGLQVRGRKVGCEIFTLPPYEQENETCHFFVFVKKKTYFYPQKGRAKEIFSLCPAMVC